MLRWVSIVTVVGLGSIVALGACSPFDSSRVYLVSSVAGSEVCLTHTSRGETTCAGAQRDQAIRPGFHVFGLDAREYRTGSCVRAERQGLTFAVEGSATCPEDPVTSPSYPEEDRTFDVVAFLPEGHGESTLAEVVRHLDDASRDGRPLDDLVVDVGRAAVGLDVAAPADVDAVVAGLRRLDADLDVRRMASPLDR